MTRNPYLTALWVLSATSAGLGVLIWLFSAVSLSGNYPDDPGWLASQNFGGWLILAGAVLLVVWLVASAALYREPVPTSALTEPSSAPARHE